MKRVVIVDDDGWCKDLVYDGDVIDLDEFDLTKSFARQFLPAMLLEAIEAFIKENPREQSTETDSEG